MIRWRGLLVGVLLAGPLYLLLIDTTSTPELVAGGVSTLLAAAVFELSYSHEPLVFRPRWLARSWRLAMLVPSQALVVCAEVLSQAFRPRPYRGRVRSVEFDAGGERPADVGRRALAEVVGSLSPNTIVIGIDPDSNRLLVHELRGQTGRDSLDPLELGFGGDDHDRLAAPGRADRRRTGNAGASKRRRRR